MNQKALDVFFRQKRFDIIFKYLYAHNPNQVNRDAYLENIRAFNNFHEEYPSDGIPKESEEDFITSFDRLIINFTKEGYNEKKGPIPIGSNGEIQDGAHRLAIGIKSNIELNFTPSYNNNLWDYKFFKDRGMNSDVMDYGALEYVKINPCSYIVNLYPIADPKKDEEVEHILEKYGFIYYKKNVWLTKNGLINLKKIQYGFPWENATWIGNTTNKYNGALNHALRVMGKNPTRIYVFVCNDFKNVLTAKEEIRNIYCLGKAPIHINDSHDEAIQIAQTYFNPNTLFLLNTKPYYLFDSSFFESTEKFKEECMIKRIDLNDIVAVGSTSLNVFGIRTSNDFDFMSLNESFEPKDSFFSQNNKLSYLYPLQKDEIIQNPEYHFYYNGVKFVSLWILMAMKSNRNELPRDKKDCNAIKSILRYKRTIEFFNKHINIFKRPFLINLNHYYIQIIYCKNNHNIIRYLVKQSKTYAHIQPVIKKTYRILHLIRKHNT